MWNEFAPDLDPTAPGNITDMRGFRISEKGVATASMVSRLCSSLPSTCFGAVVQYLLGTQTILLMTINGVYLVQNGAPMPLGTGFTNTINRWRAAAYGQDFIIVNGTDPNQYYRQSLGTMQPINANDPVAALVTATDYAVILVPPNSQTLFSNLSDTALWVPNAAAQVFSYNLAQIAGNITSVQRKRSLLVVYRQNAIQCASFVGGLIGWDFGNPGTISQTVGVKANEMIVNTGDVDYFIGPDDFWAFDGYNLTRIPNHVKEWFFGSKGVVGDLNQAFAQNVIGHYDNIKDEIMWHYPSNSTPRGQAGLIDSVVGFYNRGSPRWYMDRIPLEYALTGSAPNMHGVIQLDHALWIDDDTVPFNTVSNIYVTSQDFGDRQNIFQTKRLMPGFTLFPVPTTASPPARVTGLVQMKCGTTPVAKPSKAISDSGFLNYLVSGRLTRFQVNVYGPCELTQGAIELYPTGEN